MREPKENLIAIGDIHGCLDQLKQMIDRLGLKGDEHLVFLGDYVDRGPDSKGVIAFLRELETQARCTFLRGNHDQMMLDAFSVGEDHEQAYALWISNGGTATLDSYRSNDDFDQAIEDLEWLKKTVLYLDTPEFFFVHAGLRPDLTVRQNILSPERENVFLWFRNHHQAKDHMIQWEKVVVCGHTIHRKPVNRRNLICIDTGAFLSHWGREGKLTAVRLPDRAFVAVQ